MNLCRYCLYQCMNTTSANICDKYKENNGYPIFYFYKKENIIDDEKFVILE